MRGWNAKVLAAMSSVVLGFGLCAVPPVHAEVFHTDRSTWENAVGGTIVTETFDPAMGFPLTSGSGYPGSGLPQVNGGNTTSVSFASGLVSDGNNLSDHQCNGSTGQGAGSSRFLGCIGVADDALIWNLPFSTLGFFGSFELDEIVALSHGLSVVVLFDQGSSETVEIVPQQIEDEGSGDFGIVSLQSFSALRWETSADGTVFGLDDFSISRQAEPVPEPATLALLGLGLAGIGLSRRKQ